MATLREIRRRIAGVKSTQKITKAMKMVAAAKLRRAQDAIVSARPYARKMRDLLQNLAGGIEQSAHPLLMPRQVERVAIVVVTSDRGLCGAFNTNIVKAAVNLIRENYREISENGKVRLVTVGKKGYDFFIKRDYKVVGKHVGIFGSLNFGHARSIMDELVHGYRTGEFDKVVVLYNEFKSVIKQHIVIEQLLPVPAEGASSDAKTPHLPTDYIYEPSSTEIIDTLLPKHLNFQMWRILLESNAAEQGARMTAMENATSNAGELISTLTLSYNKARQASITKELLEIVSGAEALKKAG
jgi:F-type H+-transporting ATPase subunit gamma